MKRADLVSVACSTQRFAAGPTKVSLKMWAILATIAGGILCTILLRAADASLSEDQKSVAELGAQYQAAVKKNDVATMDRLLADDFILVTGLGKTYTKARSARRSAQWTNAVRTPGGP